jgi:hypothetical protein
MRRRRNNVDIPTLQLRAEGMGHPLTSKAAPPAFYDFNVWNAKKVTEKLNYMHLNPVQRKLVKHPRDWPWSSYAFYAKGERGLIRVDGKEEPETKKRRD